MTLIAKVARAFIKLGILIMAFQVFIMSFVFYKNSNNRNFDTVRMKLVAENSVKEEMESSNQKLRNLFRFGAKNTPSAYLQGNLFTFSESKICELPESKSVQKDLVVILIASLPERSGIRHLIRHSWANPNIYKNLSMNYVTLFVVNKPESYWDRASLLMETFMTNDVIVVNVAENYKLLTVQLMIGYMWVHEKCPGAKYVLKVDDDTYAYLGTVEHIIRRTEERNTVKASSVYGGRCAADTKVLRPTLLRSHRRYRKWMVPTSKYSEPVYPMYCNGPAYFFSANLLPQIVSKCPFHCIGIMQGNLRKKTLECFWTLEDVFFGSCIATFSNKPFTDFDLDMYNFSLLGGVPSVESLNINDPPFAIHPVKSARVLEKLHRFYHGVENESLNSKRSIEISDST